MSEVHENEENTNQGAPNGADVEPAKKTHREAIVETSVVGDVITYKFTNDEVVVMDVSKFPANVQHDELIGGCRNTGRLSFQKESDPAKAAVALKDKIARMMKGESHTVGRVTRKECTPLTEAIARVSGKTIKEVEEVWYPAFFDDEKKSGCTKVVVKGKVRIYNKEQALERLALDPGVKGELDKVLRERQAKLAKTMAASGAQKIDVAGMFAPATPAT